MKHTLHIQHRAVEGAIIRVLGLVERRGFRVDRVEVGESRDGSQTMRLVVAGERPVALLQRQLERLHDVFRVDTGTPEAPGAPGPGAPNWNGAPAVRPVERGN
jgi:acetolactate synthase regulatory subunit